MSYGVNQGEVDRLVERGLERYGAGDIDGALAAWQEALGVDPDDMRAGAYLEYVRDNYAMLTRDGGRAGEEDVPFDLGAVPGDDDYEIEVTRAAKVAQVEQYLESVDEGWFLDEEAAPLPPRPTRSLPLPARDGTLGDGDGAREPRRDDDAGFTLELEAELPEPGDDPGLDEEQTRDFFIGAHGGIDLELGGAGSTPGALDDLGLAEPLPPQPAPPGDGALELDFGDQRSIVPTREMQAPQGFVRPRMPSVPAPGVPLPGVAPLGPLGGDADDDSLGTRPGRLVGNTDADPVSNRLSADALASFGELRTGAGHAGPDDRTREVPPVRLDLGSVDDTGDMPADVGPGDLGDDERTTERSSLRLDTSSEATIERGPGYSIPAPLDGSIDQSGTHPPLVIIDDAGLAEPAAPSAHRAETSDGNDLAAETVRARRPSPNAAASSPAPPAAPTASAFDGLAAGLAVGVQAAGAAADNPADRTRLRVTWLIDRAVAASAAADHATAIVALDLALAEDPDSAVAQKLLHRHQPAILDVYQAFVGNLEACPTLAIPMHELSDQRLDTRAAFLLSRVDGTITFEEILDVAGMQRLEAFRHLSMLLLRGILGVR